MYLYNSRSYYCDLQMLRLSVITWTILLSISCTGNGYTPQDMTDLGEHIQTVLDCADIPGAQIAVVKDGEVVLEQGMGIVRIQIIIIKLLVVDHRNC